MQFNIIYVPEKMSFRLNDADHHLGVGVYVIFDNDVKYLYATTDISLEEANILAEKKMEAVNNG